MSIGVVSTGGIGGSGSTGGISIVSDFCSISPIVSASVATSVETSVIASVTGSVTTSVTASVIASVGVSTACGWFSTGAGAGTALLSFGFFLVTSNIITTNTTKTSAIIPTINIGNPPNENSKSISVTFFVKSQVNVFPSLDTSVALLLIALFGNVTTNLASKLSPNWVLYCSVWESSSSFKVILET